MLRRFDVPGEWFVRLPFHLDMDMLVVLRVVQLRQRLPLKQSQWSEHEHLGLYDREHLLIVLCRAGQVDRGRSLLQLRRNERYRHMQQHELLCDPQRSVPPSVSDQLPERPDAS